MRKLVLLFVFVIFIFGVSYSTDWLMFCHDLKHIGYTTDSGPKRDIVVAWRSNIGDEVVSSPVIYNGVLYIGSKDNNVYALNITNGHKIWNYTTGDKVVSSPAIYNGVLYIGSWDHNVYALNITNGHKIWNYTTGDRVISSPVVYNGVLYIGSWDHNVYALNITNGHKIWNYTTGGWVESSPAVSNGVVYIGSYDHKVYALNATNGHKIWNYTTGKYVWSSPTISNGVVYFGSSDHNVYALNATNGSLIWKFDTHKDFFTIASMSIHNGVLYVGSGKLYALNATNGTEIWEYKAHDWDQSFPVGWVITQPTISDGVLYFGAYDNKTYAVNATNGHELWDYKTGGCVWSSPAVSNGVVYFGSVDHNVYAIIKDNIPPTVTINFPENKIYKSINLINATVTDNYYVGNVTAEIDGNQNITLVNENGTDYYYNNTINITSDGNHIIKIYAYDRDGNLNDEKNITFIIDSTPPNILIKCSNDTVYLNRGITCNVTVIDNHKLSNMICNDHNYKLYGNKSSKIISVDTTSVGEHTLKCIAYDSVGNKAVKEHSYDVLEIPKKPIHPISVASTNNDILYLYGIIAIFIIVLLISEMYKRYKY